MLPCDVKIVIRVQPYGLETLSNDCLPWNWTVSKYENASLLLRRSATSTYQNDDHVGIPSLPGNV